MHLKLFKFIILIVALFIVVGTGYYVAQSGRVFAKALALQERGRDSIAVVAHQAVLNNYPFSPFATASRALLYNDVDELYRMNQIRESLGADQADISEIGNSIFVDYFVFSGLGYISLLGILGILQRQAQWKGLKTGAAIRRMVFATLLASGYWVFIRLYFNDPRFTSWRSAVDEVDSGFLSEEGLFIVTLAVAGLVLFWVFIALCRFLGSFSAQDATSKATS